MYHFIDDGYTQDGYIAALADCYPALAFRYRPALDSERIELGRRTRDVSVEEEFKATREFLLRKLISWEAVGPAGAVALDDKHLRGLHHGLTDRLINIVCGWAASDPTPGQPAQPPGIETEAADQKN